MFKISGLFLRACQLRTVKVTKGSTTSLLWLLITFCSLSASRLSSFYLCHSPCFCPRWPLEFSAPSCYYDPFPSCCCSGGDSHCFSSAVVAIAASAALGHQSYGPMSIQTADLLLSQSSGCASAAALLLLLLYFLCCFFLSVTSSAPITSSRQGKTTQEANFCTGRRIVSQPIYQVTKLCSYNQRMGVCLNHSKPGIPMKVCFIPIAALSFQHLSQQSH